MLKFVAISVCVLLMLGSPAPSSAGMLPGRQHDSKYFLLYTYEKAAAQCFGDDYMREFGLKMREFFAKCYFQANLINTEFPSHSYNRLSSFKNSVAKDVLVNSDLMKKSPFYNVHVVRALKNDVMSNVNTISCLFDYLDLHVTSNGTVDGTAMLRSVENNMKIPRDVKGFLVEGVKKCEDQSNTGDFLRWGKKYENFFKILQFFRCTELEKMLSCMKADLKNDAADFDLNGLDGELSDVDDVARRYFIASSYANWDTTGLFDH